MSHSLLKRSIAIVEEDLGTTKKKKKNNQKSTATTSATSKQNKKSLFDLIPEKQKLYGNYKNNRGNRIRYEKLQQVEKLNVSDIRKLKMEKTSKTAENLQKLLRFGANKMDPNITKKLLGHVEKGQRSKNKNEDDKPKEEVSIFTEDDFNAFEKEYFNS